jgi:hypothetical protein
MQNAYPFLLKFPKIGASSIGFISIAEIKKTIPFSPKRIFWTYYTPERIIRGRHANMKNTNILIAVTGKITVTTETLDGTKKTFSLQKPDVGLVIPPWTWHTMRYSHSAVQLVLSAYEYKESEYIREYKKFSAYTKRFRQKSPKGKPFTKCS